jgi:hypothetical protein
MNQCRARPSIQNRTGLQKITAAPILPQQSGSRILRRKVGMQRASLWGDKAAKIIEALKEPWASATIIIPPE